MNITKGPWSGPVNNASRFEIQGDGRRIAVVDKIEDAQLMLAAPELLEALKNLMSAIYYVGPDVNDKIGFAEDMARAAIANAVQS